MLLVVLSGIGTSSERPVLSGFSILYRERNSRDRAHRALSPQSSLLQVLPPQVRRDDLSTGHSALQTQGFSLQNQTPSACCMLLERYFLLEATPLRSNLACEGTSFPSIRWPVRTSHLPPPAPPLGHLASVHSN